MPTVSTKMRHHSAKSPQPQPQRGILSSTRAAKLQAEDGRRCEPSIQAACHSPHAYGHQHVRHQQHRPQHPQAANRMRRVCRQPSPATPKQHGAFRSTFSQSDVADIGTCHASSRKHVAASGWLRATAARRQAAARRRATAAEAQTRQCRTLTTGRVTASSRTLTSSLACSSRRLQQRAACWRGPPDCRDCTVCNGIWHTQRHMARNHAGYLDIASSQPASTHKPHEHHGSKPRACHAGGRLSGPKGCRNLRVVHLRCDKWMVGENGRLAGSHGFDTKRGCLRLACEAVGCVWQARLARQTGTLVDATTARTALCWNVD
ncbi:hypothetical protein BC831DRAFT_152510 [Entophlyctis helioformis]|nr:hypothetical protein BC831DRAFT_152510 [Entophlyctis helioformis]